MKQRVTQEHLADEAIIRFIGAAQLRPAQPQCSASQSHAGSDSTDARHPELFVCPLKGGCG